MTKHNKILLALGLCSVCLAGCPTDPVPTDAPVLPGTDAPVLPGEDAPIATGGCATYCTQVTANCTAANAQYDDMADCMAYCTDVAWPAGADTDTTGNTLGCRLYHVGVAAGDPATHCGHAGPTGGSVCGASLTFRTDAASAYTNVDRMGMPAVATALVPSDSRNAYNDGTPNDDASLAFATAALTTLTAIHAGLDDDLTAAGLTPCSMTETRDLPVGPGGTNLPIPLCAAQAVAAGGPPVVSLVLPDTLSINPATAAGFPNGRMLADPVIDVTLAIILLDLESGPTGCGGAGCTAGTLAGLSGGMGLNPAANDVAFSTTFPYLAPIHTP